jgi:hypothetical protein
MKAYAENEKEEEREETLASALEREWKGAPWYVGSIGVHGMLFLILLMIPVENRPRKPRPIPPEIVLVDTVPDDDSIDLPPDMPDNTKVEVEVMDKIEPTEVNVTTDINTDADLPNDLSAPEDDLRANVDSVFDNIEDSRPPTIGVISNGPPPGMGGKFNNRRGPGKYIAGTKGGIKKTDLDTLARALRWLALHQEEDGSWSNAKYGGGGHEATDVSVTAMATLAFLADGNSFKYGEYRTNVRKAVQWLLTRQAENGSIGPHKYEAAISTMAMAEAYAMTGEAKLLKSAQKAVDWAVSSQCAAGGWDYKPSSQRNDTSVAGWWTMAIKSAKTAGLHVPYETFEKAAEYFKRATVCEYDSAKTIYATENASSIADIGGATSKAPAAGRLVAVSLCCLQFLGQPRNDPQVRAALGTTLANLTPAKGNCDFYGWYYGTLGVLQAGRNSNSWDEWRVPLQKYLNGAQVRTGSCRENKGSWNPETDAYGAAWGRVGQTALGALMIEASWRYGYGEGGIMRH